MRQLVPFYLRHAGGKVDTITACSSTPFLCLLFGYKNGTVRRWQGIWVSLAMTVTAIAVASMEVGFEQQPSVVEDNKGWGEAQKEQVVVKTKLM